MNLHAPPRTVLVEAIAPAAAPTPALPAPAPAVPPPVPAVAGAPPPRP
jgi:hypothetical protein